MQNVIVLGGSYGGVRAAHLLANGLGSEYRVIMVDRNSHANHLYTMPRFGVVPGHEHKTFIPYNNIYKPRPNPTASTSTSPEPEEDQSRHLILQAKVLSINTEFVTLDRAFPQHGFHKPEIPYRYAVYALGSLLPKPIDLWSPHTDECVEEVKNDGKDAEELVEDVKKPYSGTKAEGIEWLRKCQERIRRAGSVLCVGGGALGIQFATDIKSLYPEKQVTLLHSRHRLLPRFDYDLHAEVKKTMEELSVEMILGERLDLSSTTPEAVKYNERGQRVVKTVSGREVAADMLLLCTGQTPNTDILRQMAPESVDPQSKLAYVLPTMQLGVIPVEPPVESPTEPEAELQKLTLADQSTDSVILSSLDKAQSPSCSTPVASSSLSTSTSVFENDLETEDIDDEPEFETLPETPYGHIFAVGDAADAFGAIKAGHTAYWQAEVAARNIIRLARHQALQQSAPSSAQGPNELECDNEASQNEKPTELELESYAPGLPAIKVSLGVGQCSAYQIDGRIGRKDTVDPDDLDVELAWPFFGFKIERPEDAFA